MFQAPTRQILRASLTTRGANGASAFIPQCTKIVFEYCDNWSSSDKLRTYLAKHIKAVAESHPHVEFVVKQRPFKQPIARGFYVNGRTKEIGLKKLEITGIQQKIQLLLDSSGAKIKPLKRETIQSTSDAARGIWSGLHVEEPFRI
ncbi:hypothetical protein SISNIDRAFT_549639 [Sistotremastrum niveocremeum HHB9708]|uniref:Large ribosomal subunit protein mL43 n=2 Tax=Sistotremastraceae TaxID=3402574 RepID=A0A164UHW9_9AGAM|nr:hypothetical protein SISNIDRAFT_549639 [Sistotremastrum niveocremeum HHB9708]KZT36049.1 mitochondrial ribosomal protein subunit L51 [Sistotremastrum suecicum HHB10207 ss-3]